MITSTIFSGPMEGIINSGLMELSSGPADFVQAQGLRLFAISGITLNGSTLTGDITNSGTIMASATAATNANAANSVSAKGIVLGGGPNLGRTVAMNFTGNIVNSGTLAISADGAGASATGIEVDAAAGTTHAGIVNSGVISVVGTNGATSIGIKASTPITGGITNTGILTAGTAAINLTQETGGSTVITQAAGLTAGNVLGGGGDVLNLTGGTLALSATNRVAGLASFTQGPGGTLALQVTPSTAPGTFPTIHAGTIALGGTLQVLPSGVLANYVNGVTFRDVFSASTPITGSFASITTSIPLLTASVTPDTADAFNLVLGLDRQALAASAQDLTQSLRFGLDAQRTLIGSVQDRLVIGEDYDGGVALGDGSPLANGQLQKPDRGNVWARAYGVVGNASASEGAPSYSTNAAGFIVGADWKAAPNFLIGVAANYAASSLDFADGGRTNVASYQGAIYTGWNSGPWYATGIAALGVNAFGTSRQLAALGLPGSATSSPNGQSYAGYAETGYRFSQQGFAVTPYAGLGYIHAHIDGFTETGGFGALAVNAGSSDSLSTDLGVRLATSFSIAGLNPITPEVKLGWRHEFLDAAQTLDAAVAGLPGSDFTVKGTNFGRESAVVGLTVTQALGSSARLFVAYDGQFSRKLDEHVFTAGFKASF
ncbi:MAG: autotransporter domain-containing protein [Hyphomicrobiales bacterium]|nr:autotransporter domain-containing protein [Hyphomicrobiales bacterium]